MILTKLGIAKEQSAKGAALLERASGQSSLESHPCSFKYGIYNMKIINSKQKQRVLKHLRVNVPDVADMTAQEEINVRLMASDARSAKE